jgi:hypothetical protein
VNWPVKLKAAQRPKRNRIPFLDLNNLATRGYVMPPAIIRNAVDIMEVVIQGNFAAIVSAESREPTHSDTGEAIAHTYAV